MNNIKKTIPFFMSAHLAYYHDYIHKPLQFSAS
jgi:hypothetical protein